MANIEKKLDKLETGPVKTVERVAVEKEPDTRAPFVLAAILFGQNKAEPSAGQNIDLFNVAQYLKEHPKAKIRLDGYGDKEKGNPEQNLKIAIKRADRVRRLLIDTYGIESGRIETQAFGSSAQPYEKNEWNRVVVIRVIE